MYRLKGHAVVPFSICWVQRSNIFSYSFPFICLTASRKLDSSDESSSRLTSNVSSDEQRKHKQCILPSSARFSRGYSAQLYVWRQIVFPLCTNALKQHFFLVKFTLTSFLYAEHLRKTKYQYCSMTKSEGAYVYSRFDITNTLHTCFQRLNAMQISLWHQLWNRPKSLQSSSNRCKEAFCQKEYFQVRLPLIMMSSKLQLHTSN